MIKIFQKFENFKFYPKITKNGVIKNIDLHPINSINYATDLYQTFEEEVPGPLVPDKIQKHEKIKYFKKLLKFVILKY